ncbi:UNVERIFIED_CONTAM: hypothetical protein Sradi_2140400, partial [Sesamum radiatum]
NLTSTPKGSGNKICCAMSVNLQSTCFRAGSQVGMTVTNLQVEGVRGSDQVSGTMDIKKGSQDIGHHEQVEVRSSLYPNEVTRDFEFCNDDADVEFETIFRSAFGGNRYFYWSFTTDDEPRYRNSSSYSSNYRTSTGWRYHYEDEYDSSSEYEKPMTDLTSDRLALGLSASGPINLEDVKNA